MDVAQSLTVVKRGCVECHTEDDLKKKFASGRKLRIKLGVDPTSADLHLGHTVQFNRLRAFQDLGHTAVLIIGDYTARVGDPSGRDSTRPPLTQEAIDANAKTYKDQAFKILDPGKTELRYNSEWLVPFVQKEMFAMLQRYTVNQLMQREDFAARQAKNQPITLIEILYPIFQGYDSVAIKADVELGGNDQLFNILMGRQMQKDAGLEPQVALTLPLLVGLDGVKKMSKSYGNSIPLTDSPRDMFGKVMKIGDELMRSYYELLTTEDLSKLGELHPMEAKKRLAEIITGRFHGAEAGKAERAFFDETFSKGKVPELEETPLAINGCASWSQVLVQLKAAPSRKEAQRLVSQGAFRIEGEPVKTDAFDDKSLKEYLVLDKVLNIQVGKHKFFKVRVK
ncbi:MAG: tyrosine--tRNA ligase [Elusimicrobia bacterium]|nr:tyrosine--tRNA ligase [Elusimicrobiota bacterium]